MTPPNNAQIPAGGAPSPDQDLFTISVNDSGDSILEFLTVPDFENTTSGNSKLSDYSVTVYASDSQNLGFLKININIEDVLPSIPLASVIADKKRLVFNWQPDPEAAYYELWIDPDGTTGTETFQKIPTTINGQNTQFVLPIGAHKLNWLNVIYQVKACELNGINCQISEELFIRDQILNSIIPLKGGNTKNDDSFGQAIALSADGKTLAVGAKKEQNSFHGVCNGTGVPDSDGNIACQLSNTITDNTLAPQSGAVYVFKRLATQLAYLKSANAEGNGDVFTAIGDRFGSSVALSGNGKLLAIGAPYEDGSFTGIHIGPGGADAANTVCSDLTTIIEDNCTSDAGAVYIFARGVDDRWYQEAYLKPSVTRANDNFGSVLAWDFEGTRLADRGLYQTIIDSAQAVSSGSIYVFNRELSASWR